ncbi:hypothetical protein Tco_0327843 [Tanacetum coccineum]
MLLWMMMKLLVKMHEEDLEHFFEHDVSSYHQANLGENYTSVPLDEIRVDDKLNFMEEPVEISEREFKKLKRSRIAIVNVRWNSKRGPEFTWEHED